MLTLKNIMLFPLDFLTAIALSLVISLLVFAFMAFSTGLTAGLVVGVLNLTVSALIFSKLKL